MKIARFVALALLTLAPPAWAKKKTSKEPAPTTQQAPAESAPAEGSPVTGGLTSMSFGLEMLDRGAEPRQELRLHPPLGSTHGVEMVLDMRLDMNVGGMGNAVDTPPVAFGMRSTVDELLTDGSFRTTTAWLGARTLEGGDAPPEVTAAMMQSFTMLEGLTLTQVMDPTGHTRDFAIVGSPAPEVATALSGVQQNMQQSQVLLPAEAVGVGARWKMTISMVSSGIPIVATSVYTLQGFDGEAVLLHSDITMSVDTKSMMANLPPGAQVSMDRFEATGGGDMRWDLRELFPTGDLLYTMNMLMSAVGDAGAMKVGMNMDYGMKMRRLE